ncbi:MAG: SRPBCC family protein [Flavobacteriia bacterium]|nr:SRPBCC family protein [Flavobacteriia bacterium]
MPTIELITEINAPLSVVFDLSRSVDVHVESLAHTNERPIAGVKSGCMGMDDWVTWQAKHLGFTWKLTSLITEFDSPHSFTDEMVQGPFKMMVHRHTFLDEAGRTVMKDVFEYEAPMGWLGRLADVVFLRSYMQKLLSSRNAVLKANAEKR